MYLQIKNIHKFFGTGENRTEVLKGINCNIEKGSICVLLGPSGSGKSTLLNIIGGIETAEEGSISINGDTIENMNEKQLSLYRRKHLGYVFQSYNLIPNLTVRENIEVGAYLSDNPLNVDDLMKTAYMSSFIGQTFEGVVANVTNFGMFVELDNSVEGLIRVENMTDDYYEYDEKVNTLTGRRKQKSYTTGDVVNIVVARTDILSRQIDFVLAKDADRKLLKKFAKPIEIPKSEKHGKKSKRKKSFKKYNKKKK